MTGIQRLEMAEIKSTLDLVMERTRHLSLSEEEREAHKVEEIRKTYRGTAQKYLDGMLTRDELSQELARSEERFGPENGHFFTDELLDRVALMRDNQRLFDLLRDCCGVSPSALNGIVESCNRAIAQETRIEEDRVRTELSSSRGVAGSAVLPNLDGDAGWKEKERALLERFDRELLQAKAKLVSIHDLVS